MTSSEGFMISQPLGLNDLTVTEQVIAHYGKRNTYP